MKAGVIVCCVILYLLLIGCERRPQPTFTPVLLSTTSSPVSNSSGSTETAALSTKTPFLQSVDNLPSTVEIHGDMVLFNEWGFSIELSSDVWKFDPKMYNKTSNFEGFVFSRKEKLVESSGKGFAPSVGVMFYSIPENTQLVNFSTILRTQLGESFPTIDSTFGYEGSEPKLRIPALGYYGHMGENKEYSVYIVHSVKSTVGVQFSFEIVDTVLDQAKTEVFEIMQSMEFAQ